MSATVLNLSYVFLVNLHQILNLVRECPAIVVFKLTFSTSYSIFIRKYIPEKRLTAYNYVLYVKLG